MRIETERIIITDFDLSMAESVHRNSLDEDNRRFVPDEVFETVEEVTFSVVLLKAASTVNADMMFVEQIHQKLETGYAEDEAYPNGESSNDFYIRIKNGLMTFV